MAVYSLHLFRITLQGSAEWYVGSFFDSVDEQQVLVTKPRCGAFSLAKGQAPTQPLSHPPSQQGKRGEIRRKSLWVEDREITSYHQGQNTFRMGKANLIFCQLR